MPSVNMPATISATPLYSSHVLVWSPSARSGILRAISVISCSRDRESVEVRKEASYTTSWGGAPRARWRTTSGIPTPFPTSTWSASSARRSAVTAIWARRGRRKFSLLPRERKWTPSWVPSTALTPAAASQRALQTFVPSLRRSRATRTEASPRWTGQRMSTVLCSGLLERAPRPRTIHH